LSQVFISPSIYKRFYAGISNGLIWPAFHDCPDFIVPGLRGPENKSQIKKQWKDYRAVNRKFAEEMVKNSRSGDILFIQDYQLIMVGLEVQNELKKGKSANKNIQTGRVDIFTFFLNGYLKLGSWAE
jgi:trehalose-6-phosphate synthase